MSAVIPWIVTGITNNNSISLFCPYFFVSLHSHHSSRFRLIYLYMKIALRSSVVAFLISSFAFGQQPEVPQHLQATYNDASRTISLSWDAVDSVAGYNLFVKTYGNEHFMLWGKAGIIYANKYEFDISSDYGQLLEFAVCSIQNFPKVMRSENGNSVSIEVPSLVLPMVKLNDPKFNKKSIMVSWQYDQSIADVRGFVVMINNKPKHFDKSVHEFSLDSLPTGMYSIHVMAQSKNGVLSPPSSRRVVYVK